MEEVPVTLRERIFHSPSRDGALIGVGDVVVLLIVAVMLYLGAQLALGTPAAIQGPNINLDPAALPFYALLSIGRMLIAYFLSLIFSIFYGYTAARSKSAERWLMPLLDILQSVPILSFLPVVLLSLTAILPQRTAVELAAVVLIFTSQAWNLTFSFYQSMRTIPTEYREAAAVFRFSPWLRFKQVELPFASMGLIWNSVMSWAGGWFFLMAAEIFTLGSHDFRLPGLGAYLQTAAAQGNVQALVIGIGTLTFIIVLLDQLIWQPLLAWAEHFKVSQVEDDNPTTSWFLDSLRRSGFARAVSRRVFMRLNRWLDKKLNRPPKSIPSLEAPETGKRSLLGWLILLALALGIGYGLVQAAGMLLTIPLAAWGNIATGALATLLRVVIAVGIALAWTIPVGVLIGTNPRAASILQPLVQIAASIPATALFPVLLLGLLTIPAGADIAAVLLMLLGTQWYLLFNIIAGASAIPQDLQFTSNLLRLSGWKRWKTLILPALFPYIITGLITASGGAWNASIVAEFTEFGGQISRVTGLGAEITAATAAGNYAVLLASTLTMIVLVVMINRLVWRRLYHVAEYRFRMDQ
ncbi:MAG: ABC transporter permease subunit [Chloroflexi bacterium]|nr:ABC transporter permease subunit [Chloroflexota bacterium]MBW7879579.1 ABC transporter permease subunit [Anaerolineae bacterium]MDL1916252.1 ABC transporter permease subunit [Anaerolineae bacterium CFX4]OQY85519.1 MAG: ABC transporter permease [Anaerolineae bacterium UTCFX5]MCC6565914.1 ABC transporter permease subunit [Chloroflexota bacterium]